MKIRIPTKKEIKEKEKIKELLYGDEVDFMKILKLREKSVLKYCWEIFEDEYRESGISHAFDCIKRVVDNFF